MVILKLLKKDFRLQELKIQKTVWYFMPEHLQGQTMNLLLPADASWPFLRMGMIWLKLCATVTSMQVEFILPQDISEEILGLM